MKKTFILFSLIFILSSCGQSEPVNNSNFTEFWETSTQTFYLGEEVISGEYTVSDAGRMVCMSPDPESVNLLPPAALQGTEPSFCISNPEDFLDALGLSDLPEECFNKGTATVKLDSYLYDSEDSHYANIAEVLEYVDTGCTAAEEAY